MNTRLIFVQNLDSCYKETKASIKKLESHVKKTVIFNWNY